MSTEIYETIFKTIIKNDLNESYAQSLYSIIENEFLEKRISETEWLVFHNDPDIQNKINQEIPIYIELEE